MSSNSLPVAYFELVGRVQVFKETWYLDGELEEYFKCLDLLLCTLAEKPQLRWILNSQRLKFLCREVDQLHCKMEVDPMPHGSEARKSEMLKRFLHLVSTVRFPCGITAKDHHELKGIEFEMAADAATKVYYRTLPVGVEPLRHGWVRHLILRTILRDWEVQVSFEGPKE